MTGGWRNWLRSALLAVPTMACSTATRVEYHHDPTTNLHETYDLSRPELQPFTVDGVVVSPYFKLLTHDSTRVLLRLVSTKQVSVTVGGAVLSGQGAAPVHSFDVATTVLTSEPVGQGAWRAAVTVGDLANTELDALGTGGATFAVDVRVGEGEARRMSFELTRHVTEQMVTH